MDTSALLQPNVTQELISSIVRSMIFAAYAVVTEVQKDGSLTVKGCVSDGLAPFITTVKVLYPTTSQVQTMFKPAVGDRVLVVGLHSYSDDMFTAKNTVRDIDENNVQHYTIFGCVAIPLNIENSKTPLRISDGDFKIDTTDTHGITINEGDDPVVRWSELREILQELWKAYNFHLHPGEVTGPPTKQWLVGEEPPSPTGAPAFTDLASEVLAVPKASTGGA